MDAALLHTVADGVATVVVSHPAKRNAMTAAMAAGEALRQVRNPQV